MKGMSTLEKRGVPAESSLSYLLETGVTDKQVGDILFYLATFISYCDLFYEAKDVLYTVWLRYTIMFYLGQHFDNILGCDTKSTDSGTIAGDGVYK